MNYDKSVQFVITTTGFSYDYIRKIIKELQPILSPYMQRGDNNSILFDSNAIVIFDQVKQLKQGGLNIKSIKEKLMSKPLTEPHKVYPTPIQTSIKTDVIETLLSDLKEAHRRTLDAKDQTILNLDKRINSLESQILLITDGRTPEQVRAEQLTKEKEILEKESRLVQAESRIMEKDNLIEEFKKKEEELKKQDREKALVLSEKDGLIKNTELSLKEKESELIRFKEEQEKQNRDYLQKEERKKNILSELDSLEGKWFVGNKRKQLLKELLD
ncbi:MAG: hypothetical protein AABZ74_06915 [Cyanobacteriota bacterium]